MISSFANVNKMISKASMSNYEDNPDLITCQTDKRYGNGIYTKE